MYNPGASEGEHSSEITYVLAQSTLKMQEFIGHNNTSSLNT